MTQGLLEGIRKFEEEERYYNQFSIEQLRAMLDDASDSDYNRIMLVIFNREDLLKKG